MDSQVSVERLNEAPTGHLATLIVESEQAGLRLVRRLADEWADGRNRFDRPGEALFVACLDGRIVGVCGLNVDPYTTAPDVGRVRHLYVLVAQRRLGIGRRLVAEVVRAACRRFLTLRLSTTNAAAARLYEGFGFHRVDDTGCTHVMPLGPHDRLSVAYESFNARDIQRALAVMHHDVEWPNGMEGGWVHGHAGVRAYWTRQWGAIDPRVEPRSFGPDAAGRVVVTVHQVVRDRDGQLLADRMVEHVYTLEDGLVRRMEIRPG